MSVVWPDPTDDSLLSEISRSMNQSSSYCLRCGISWGSLKANPHETFYHVPGDKDGYICRPLCESCWKLLGSPEARIPYYKKMVDVWDRDNDLEDGEREAIGRAVANGG